MVKLAALALGALSLSGCSYVLPRDASTQTTDCVNVGGLVFGGVSHCYTVNFPARTALKDGAK